MDKKTIAIITLSFLFILTQVFGILINLRVVRDMQIVIEPPFPKGEVMSLVYLFIMMAIMIALFFLLGKTPKIQKIWVWLALFFAVLLTNSVFFPEMIAFFLTAGIILIYYFRRSFFIHNFTQLLAYAGITIVFSSFLNFYLAVLLLMAISLYDIFAVKISKHMIALAKAQAESGVFMGFIALPPEKAEPNLIKEGKKEGISFLGGGDAVFPLLFAIQVAFFSMFQCFFVILGATLALILLMKFSDPKEFYPAMPFLSIGCFIGFLIGALL